MGCKTDIDFKKSVKKANEILLSSKTITSFPFSITDLVKEISNNTIRCCSFKRASSFNLDITDFGTHSAILIDAIACQEKNSIIFYNQEHINTRIRFSIGHELGHYVLKHDKNNKSKYSDYEIETNFFTAQLLMPEQIIWELIRRNVTITEQTLTKLFGVSKEAAQKRIETLNKRNNVYFTQDEKEVNDIILLKYKAFLDNIKPVYNRTDWFDEDYEMQKERDNWY